MTVQMKEPNCKTVDKLYWNANLKFDANYYIRKFDGLGYEKVIENNTEKYIHKAKGLVILVKINKYANEVMFLMTRLA